MLKKKRRTRVLGIFLVITIISIVFPITMFSQVNPWDPYSEYIPNDTQPIKRSLRAAWICSVINLDWPSKDSIKLQDDQERIKKSKEELCSILDKAVQMNLNAVFFQVSPEGDALYKSNVVPWSRYLTGTFGKNPGFDPLAFAIEEAHKRCLEIHAWFNPYRVSMDTKDSTIASLGVEKSVYKEHPEWIKTSMSRFVVDPGIPEAREWVNNRVMEVVNNYDIDGVHFDDYFYYENTEGELKDESTFYTYNNGQFSNIGDWRRNNTYLLVKEISNKIRTAKSWVKFGISPAGVWGNKKDGLTEGSDTSSSFTNYYRSFADTKKWVEEEIIDYIVPQIYFSFGNPRAPYGEVASWWANLCAGRNIHLYVGEAFYKFNEDSDEYFNGENAIPELSRQLKFNMIRPNVKGSVLFRIKSLMDSNRLQEASAIQDDIWNTKAFVPVMPWKGGKAPSIPINGKLENASSGVKVSWTDKDKNSTYYGIYRFSEGENIDISLDASSANLIATVRKSSSEIQEFIDKENRDKGNSTYVISALDRLHNESDGLVVRESLSKYFCDIGKEYSWAVDAIDKLHEKGIVNGVGQGIFNPRDKIKRGDFIILVVKALNLKSDFTKNFVDVEKSLYYYDAIGIARELGIAKGDGYRFNPDSNVTREDMMVFIQRALDVSGKKLEKAEDECLEGYSDRDTISSYAKSAVASLTKAGIINGDGVSVRPKGMGTRAETVVMLYKLLGIYQ